MIHGQAGTAKRHKSSGRGISIAGHVGKLCPAAVVSLVSLYATFFLLTPGQ